MKGQWMIWLLVTGVTYVSGNMCDIDHAEECYTKLVNYEGRYFPLYGKGKANLEETCKNINKSFECIESYLEECNGNDECNEDCQELIKEVEMFLFQSKFKIFAKELCDESNIIMQKYLESYECLKSNLDAYTACHNKSDISKSYISTIEDETVIPATCCYFSWYYDCFSNITKERCMEDATSYVNFALSILIRPLAEKLCMANNITCSNPPLPPEENGAKEPTDKEKKDPEENGAKEPTDKGKKDPVEKVPDINDSKNDTHDSSSASIISCPVAGTVLAVFFILFINLLIY